jgi:acyl carrier protein
MTPDAIEQKIRAIVLRIAPHVKEGFGGSADLYREVGVKSFAALDMLLSLEEEFGVSIEDEVYGDARSVDKLVAMIGSLLRGLASAGGGSALTPASGGSSLNPASGGPGLNPASGGPGLNPASGDPGLTPSGGGPGKSAA